MPRVIDLAFSRSRCRVMFRPVRTRGQISCWGTTPPPPDSGFSPVLRIGGGVAPKNGLPDVCLDISSDVEACRAVRHDPRSIADDACFGGES